MAIDRPTSRRRFLGSALIGSALLGLGAAAGTTWKILGAKTRRGAELLGDKGHPGYTSGAIPGEVPQGAPGVFASGYGLAAVLASPVPRPVALALDGAGSLYIAGAGKVAVVNSPGSKPSIIAVDGNPACLTIAPDQSVYLGIGPYVHRLDPTGRPVARWPMPEPGAVLTALALTARHLLVADAGNRAVWILDSHTGQAQSRLGQPGQFIVPSPYFDLAVDHAGTVWVGNPGRHRVEHYAADGRLLEMWGAPGAAAACFCGCCNPSYLAAGRDPTGQPCIVTSEKGIPRVKILGPRGEFRGEFRGLVADPRDFPAQARGLDVAIDPAGSVFVLDPYAQAVRIYLPRQESAGA